VEESKEKRRVERELEKVRHQTEMKREPSSKNVQPT